MYENVTSGCVITSCCRLCRSVGGIKHVKHSKILFVKNNRALLTTAETLYATALPQIEQFPHLLCRPCETQRRQNNFKDFKTTILENQTLFERVKSCMSPSTPRILKSSD